MVSRLDELGTDVNLDDINLEKVKHTTNWRLPFMEKSMFLNQYHEILVSWISLNILFQLVFYTVFIVP